MTDKEIKYTAGGGLLGLATGILLRRLVDGSRKTKISDYLLWGGIGAGLGAGGGYLAGADRKMGKSEIGFINDRIKKNKEALAKAKQRRDEILDKKHTYFGMRSGTFSTLGGIVIPIAAAGLAQLPKLPGKYGALPRTLEPFLTIPVKNPGKTALLPGTALFGVTKLRELTDPSLQNAEAEVAKLEDQIGLDETTLKNFEPGNKK